MSQDFILRTGFLFAAQCTLFLNLNYSAFCLTVLQLSACCVRNSIWTRRFRIGIPAFSPRRLPPDPNLDPPSRCEQSNFGMRDVGPVYLLSLLVTVCKRCTKSGSAGLCLWSQPLFSSHAEIL